MRRLRLVLALLLGLGSVGAGAASVPWSDGEQLDYLIRWGPLLAASARFTAHRDGDSGWRFTLDLSTRGPVEAVHPVRSQVYSKTRTDPWRSVAYGETRVAGEKSRNESGTIDYAAHTGAWHEERNGVKKDTAFAVPDAAIDDMGSMLYGLRLVTWKEGVVVPLRGYDGPKVEKAEAVLLRREAFVPVAGSPAVPCLVVRVKPVYDDPAKNAKGYGVTLWITDDAKRIPLHAELQARFGTFTLDRAVPGADTGRQ